MEQDLINFAKAKQWTGKESVGTGLGIYAIFLKSVDNVPENWRPDLERDDKLLYIGKAESGIKNRINNHFNTKKSSADTFRRSVGAILRNEWGLMPAKAGGTWRFDENSEQKISKWIQENCCFDYWESQSEDMEDEGEKLVKCYCPPLNLRMNPEKIKRLEDARAECRAIAGIS